MDLKTANVMLLSSSSACLTDWKCLVLKSFTVKREDRLTRFRSLRLRIAVKPIVHLSLEVSTDIKFDPKKCDVFPWVVFVCHGVRIESIEMQEVEM